eukprot:10727651-Alexandrium_andersonii.AAC.1
MVAPNPSAPMHGGLPRGSVAGAVVGGGGARELTEVEGNVGHGLEHSSAVTMTVGETFLDGNYTPTPGNRPSAESQFFFPENWHPVDLVRYLYHKQASGELLPW